MTIRRLSSRVHRLDENVLAEHLNDARSYRRIAGYFTSSLVEIALEWLEAVEEVRDSEDLAPTAQIEWLLYREDVAMQPCQRRASGAHCTRVRFPNRATNRVGYVVGYRRLASR